MSLDLVKERGVPLDDPMRRSRLMWDGMQWEQRGKETFELRRF